MRHNERDHGFGASPEVDGAPRVLKKIKEECPNCNCPEVYMIEVDLVDNPEHARLVLLKGKGRPKGTYIGCPACPFASPMMTTRENK